MGVKHVSPVSEKGWNERERRLWSLSLFAGAAMLYASRATLPLAIAKISIELDWTKATSGSVLSAFFWGYALTQIFAGSLADRYGGERILYVSSLVWIVLTVATPLVLDLAVLTGRPVPFAILLRIATGVAQGFYMPSMASICSRNLNSTEKGRIFGFCLAGTHLGVVIAGFIGSSLLTSYGWRSLFHFIGATALIWVAVYHYILSSTSEKRKLSNLPTISISESALEVPWKTLFTHPGFWAATVAHYTGSNAYFMIFNWLPTFFHDVYPDANGVLYNVLPGLAIVCTSTTAPYVAAKLHAHGHSLTRTRKIVEGASLVGMALLLYCISPLAPFAVTLALFTLAMAIRGLHHGGVSVNPTDFAPNHTGAVFGIFNSFGAITGFVGTFVAGHMLEATNNDWTAVFWLTALQNVIGAAVYATFGNRPAYYI
ncbi:hypothetical protein PENTCL1PPCAC_30704, partial [Pristionchus entomophagus]